MVRNTIALPVDNVEVTVEPLKIMSEFMRSKVEFVLYADRLTTHRTH